MTNKKKNKKQISDELLVWFEAFSTQVDALRKKDNGSLIGKYFIVRDGEVKEHYDSFETAYQACIQRYHDGRFLIQELLPTEYVNFVFAAS